MLHISGAQREIFQGRGGFVKLEHFDKNFIKKSRKKAPQGRILEFFLLNTLKTTFWMANLTKGWTHSGHFFPKSGHFFWFLKKDRGGLPPSPPSCVPVFSEHFFLRTPLEGYFWECIQQQQGYVGARIYGPSIHNQRIERLHYDTTHSVLSHYIHLFLFMEEEVILDRNSIIDLLTLHCI